METLNTLRECALSAEAHRELARTFVLILAPLAPFLSEELWEQLGGAFSVHQQRWPAYDPALLAAATIVVPVQINGKLRGRVEVDAAASEAEITQAALAAPAVQRHLAGLEVRKTMYWPGRLVNIVAS
jgi:leucyl-tRNA synthetase